MASQQGERGIYVVGVKELLRALNKIDKDLNNEVRDASQVIAYDLVSAAGRAAQTPLQQLAASGLKVKRDRVPVVKVGRNIIRPGTRETDVFYGAEFGGGARPTTQQFLEHKGQRGYFLYPTARARGARYAEMWAEAIDKAFRAWDDKSARTATS